MAGQVISKITAGDASINLVANSAYFYSETPAATATKVAIFTTTDQNAFVPIEGTTINVRFLYNNTAADPTLTLKTHGGAQVFEAKPIYAYGTTDPTSNSQNSWSPNSVVSLTYDTTVTSTGCWMMNDYKVGNTDKSVAQGNSTTNAAYPLLFANNTTTATKTGAVYKSAKMTANPSTGIITATNLNITSTLTADNVNINASAITEGVLNPSRVFTYTQASGSVGTGSETYIATSTTAPTSYSNTGWTVINLGNPGGAQVFLCWGILKVTTTPNVKYGDYCYRNANDIYMRLPKPENVLNLGLVHVNTICSSPLGGSAAGNFYISFGGLRGIYQDATGGSPVYGIPFRVQTFGSFNSTTWYASIMMMIEGY